MVGPVTTTPTSFGTIRVANPGADRYWHEMRGAYAGLRLYDPDFAIARDPWIYEKMLRDPLVRQCLADRKRAVAGGTWSMQPARNPTKEDEEAARVMEQVIAELDYNGFQMARVNLSNFVWEGMRHAVVYGHRMDRPFGDGVSREWWVPTKLRDMNKRRVRVWREGGDMVRRIECILDADGLSFEQVDWPEDRIITAVYDDEESRLGFGRGLGDSCYWFFYCRWKILEEGIDAARTWAQGIMVAKTDAGAIGDTDQDSEATRDAFVSSLKAMKARGIVAVGSTDTVEHYDGTGQGAEQLLAWWHELGDGIRELLTGSSLPTGGGASGKGSLARAEVEQDTSEGVYQLDSAILDDSITRGLVRPVWSRNRENLVDLGLGDARMPLFASSSERSEDTEKNSRIVVSMLGAGMKLKKDEAYQQLGMTPPTEEDVEEGNVVEQASPSAPGDGGGGDPFAGLNPAFAAMFGKKPKRCPDGTIMPLSGDCTGHEAAKDDDPLPDAVVPDDEKPKPKRRPAGSQLPAQVMARLKELGASKIPPGSVSASDVVVGDLDGEHVHRKPLVSWRDREGRIQSAYSAQFHAMNKATKDDRAKALGLVIVPLRDDLMDKVATFEPGTRQHASAVVAAIIAHIGMRPGSPESVKRRHYGATTMLGGHVTFHGGSAMFDFVGKNAAENKWVLDGPPPLVDAVRSYHEAAGTGPMWKGADPSKFVPEGFLTKDLRTVVGNEVGRDAIKRMPSPPPPLDPNPAKARKQIAAAALFVSSAVAKALNNTPAVAKTSYIHPEVFREMEQVLGVSEDIRGS